FPRLGPPIRNLLMGHDVLFSVGGDLFTLSLPSDVEPMPEGLTVVHMDTDPWQLGKNYPAKVAILGDPQATLPDLAEALRNRLVASVVKERAAKVAELAAAHAAATEKMRAKARAEVQTSPISPLALVGAIADAVPDDAIIVDESISSSHGVRNLFRAQDHQS